MDKQRWIELGWQALTGAIYGFVATIATVQDWTTAAWVAIGTGALKGAAHSVMKMLAPKVVNKSTKYQTGHWTQKIDRIL